MTLAETQAVPAVPLLEATGLRKTYRGLVAVVGLDLAVGEREIVGLIGPNGAGKTTTFALLSGFVAPDAGDVRFAGERIRGLEPYAIARRGLVRTFQIAKPLAGMTVLENVMVGALARARQPKRARTESEAVLARVGLERRRDRLAGELGTVDRKRLELARALATQPRLLLLDEVAAGLTPAEAEALVAIIRALRDDGIAILLIEHVMAAVMTLSDRVIVLDHGEKIAEGTPAAVARDPRVVAAYLGAPEPA